MLRIYIPLIAALAACHTSPETGTTSLTNASVDMSPGPSNEPVGGTNASETTMSPAEVAPTPPVSTSPLSQDRTTSPAAGYLKSQEDVPYPSPYAVQTGGLTPFADDTARQDRSPQGTTSPQTSFGPYAPTNQNGFPETTFGDAGRPPPEGSYTLPQDHMP